MLKASEAETEHVREYFEWQAPDLEVTFLQKVYSEAILNTRHDVWDVHTNKNRWWVITGGTNLYSQAQFPNMDLALTFHIGLMLRIPRTQDQQKQDIRVLPFAPVMEQMEAVSEALAQARSVSDYQAIGVRCRETLLSLIGVTQDAAVWTDMPPQRANFRAWVDIIFNDLLPRETNKERRSAIKQTLEIAWTFNNWLTHAKSATWLDADMAHSLAQQAVNIAMTQILRSLRGVPEECPSCGSPDLEPEHGEFSATPGLVWERPVCPECGWKGRPVAVFDKESELSILVREGEPTDEHSIMSVPLRTIIKPGETAAAPLTDMEIGPPEHSVYFAYGSNMSTQRLRARMPSCEPLGMAVLPGHALRFHKRSKDKSGKCNAFATNDDQQVIGVLFRFDPAERPALDKAEGLGNGYEHATVTVINAQGRRSKVLTYLATADAIDDSLLPYDWYKDFVVAGCAEHNLPPDYVSRYVESVPSTEDPDRARDARERKQGRPAKNP